MYDSKCIVCPYKIDEPIPSLRKARFSKNDNNKTDILNTINTQKDINTDAIEFQILDWRQYQEEDDDSKKSFIIKLFGRTRDDKTIHVHVKKYTPYFFIEINKSWRQHQIDALMATVKSRVYPHENADGLIKYETINKYKFWGFTNYEKFTFLQLTFTNKDSMRSYENVFNNKKVPLKVRQISNAPLNIKTYESNIEPFLRCMHIRNLDAVGWVRIDGGKYIKSSNKLSISEIDIECDWTALNRIEDRTIKPFIIASFDIECTSGDGTFPQANRDEDKIIQIGTTFSKLGEDECYYQHIITLGSCDPIPGVDVESYETEQEVLMAWNRLLERINPDVMTGYNIVGFDMEYLKDRSKKLGIEHKFSKLSRLIGETTEFKEAKLASSALGDNILKFYNMTGRVIVDMMKVIQRDHRLESYKLDFVASHFIKEKIKKMENNNNRTIISTESIYGLKENQYISIYYNDGITDNKHMDGKKFKILKLNKNEIEVEGIVDITVIKPGISVYWCQAKDDIQPKDIFRLQKGTSADRCLIARYCLQDCILCNKLIAKLRVLINNIGMANVCHVPLSFLFLRGQGIKILSLVAKKCREMQHLIPTIRKPKKENEDQNQDQSEKEKEEQKRFEKFIAKLNKEDDSEEDEDDSYEGAIVFDPHVGVHYEPIIVLDFASLYPKSMIERNLSHECYVIDDEKYGNLPGYKYHVTQYITNTLTRPYSKTQLREILNAFNRDKYIISVLDPGKTLRNHYKIYDKDHLGSKRWLVTEIEVGNTEIIIKNYETTKFAEKLDGTKGILPAILINLLNAREMYKDEVKKEKDPFKKSVFDGLQLAYKVTANSLYGQTGAPTSAVCMKQIAASTTATGRERLIFSKNFLENTYGTLVNLALTNKEEYLKFCNKLYMDVPSKKFYKPNKEKPEEGWTTQDEYVELFYTKMNNLLKGKRINPIVIYGDTDSTFFNPKITDVETGTVGKDRNALAIAIQLGIWASNTICLILPSVQEQQYEKVLWPFMILTKKRYVGNLYEKNPNEFKQKSMGIVLKRRDNANIVKVVVGGIVDQILNKQNPQGAIDFTKNVLKQILSGKFSIDKFIITKTLREEYKDRTRIVHAVLADRMALRDPGNKPLPNDRIAYVYRTLDKEPNLQGDRVETPDFVINNNLKIDYLFYITNQIQKPSVQFLELIANNPGQIFEDYLMRERNRREGKKPINSFLINNENDSNNDNNNNDNENRLDADNLELIQSNDIKKVKTKTKPKTSKISKRTKKINNEEKDQKNETADESFLLTL